MLRLLFPILCALAACTPEPEIVQRSTVKMSKLSPELPPMKVFKRHAVLGISKPNNQIAQDFLELSFQMESGSPLPFLTRFEGPIKIGVKGKSSATLNRDVAILIRRLQREARIDISRAKPGESPNIIIEQIPRKLIQRAIPQAACFVVPNVVGWQEFKRYRSSQRTDWRKISKRETATVIVPSDVSPQEVRDCLHEEIAQAIGPLNDLYRLPDSIFNDTNFHTVLTSFDMLILRLYYAPELQNGITKHQAAQKLPALLARLNPAGQRAKKTSQTLPSSRRWRNAISDAISARGSEAHRTRRAKDAIQIAKAAGWQDNRLAFSLFVQGRAQAPYTPQKAISALLEAKKIYQARYGDRSVQAAYVTSQIAAFALSQGQFENAIHLSNEALPAAQKYENASLLATLLMIKAEALSAKGQKEEAAKVRLDSLGWARYGFGSDRNVRARLAEIQALVPIQSRS